MTTTASGLNLNRERLRVLSAVAAGLVDLRRAHTGRTETIVRSVEAGPLSGSDWRWKRCAAAVFAPLVTAGLVEPITPDAGDPGPWTYQLTPDGERIHSEHTTPTPTCAASAV